MKHLKYSYINKDKNFFKIDIMFRNNLVDSLLINKLLYILLC